MIMKMDLNGGNMGLLMLAGLIGSIAYSSHAIKNDIKAETTDYKTKPTFNSNTNKRIISNNFNIICQRAGIKIDNNGNPLKENQCNKGVDYLKYQGYKNEDINKFKSIYQQRYKQGQLNKRKSIQERNRRLMQLWFDNNADTMVVLRKTIYKSYTSPDERMKTLLKNNLWRQIVDHHTYIKSDIIGRYEEIWTLKVPKNFFKEVDKNQLYNDICYLEGVYNGF